MAAPIPAVTPRRSARSRPIDSPPRKLKLGSKPTSRLATPVRASPFQENVSIASGMDTDELRSNLSERSISKPSHETVFARSDELTVSFYANSPVEVKHILRSAGTPSNSPGTAPLNTMKIFTEMHILVK